MVNTAEACRYLGISAKTLRRWCKYGFISYYNTVGGHKRFSLKELKDFLNKNKVTADTEADQEDETDR